MDECKWVLDLPKGADAWHAVYDGASTSTNSESKLNSIMTMDVPTCSARKRGASDSDVLHTHGEAAPMGSDFKRQTKRTKTLLGTEAAFVQRRPILRDIFNDMQ